MTRKGDTSWLSGSETDEHLARALCMMQNKADSKAMCSDLQRYYEETEGREIRQDLRFSVAELDTNERVAVDCGCGSGADIAYLLGEGFTVHAFDIERSAIDRCHQRFASSDQLTLSVSTFLDFEYPPCSLLVADASLFFCPPHDFPSVWQKMRQSLSSGGVFCGSFLGPEDTMARHPDDEQTFWHDVLPLAEKDVLALFDGFQLLRFTEQKTSGLTPQGTEHDWHIFAVVARKL